MNRNLERAKQQEVNKNKKWYYGLPPSKKAFIGWMIEQGVIKNDNITSSILDDCFIAAMVEKLELKESKELIKTANKYIEEIKNILESCKGDYLEMLKDERLREEIREKALKLLKDGQVMSRGVNDVLKKEYPKASVRDLSIIWAEAKEDLKEEMKPKSTDAEKEKFLNKIGREQQEILNKEVAADKENVNVDIPKLIKSSDVAIELNKSGFQFKNLQVLNVTLKGKFGVYEKGTEGVKIGDKIYKDITEVEEAKNNSKELTEKAKEAIKKQIEELNKELNNISTDWNEKLEKYAEIESVFSL